MGGELILTARFPDREPVWIKGFADIAGTASRSPRQRRRARRFNADEPLAGPSVRNVERIQSAFLRLRCT